MRTTVAHPQNPAATPRPLRRDAEANQARILEAAYAVFADQGFDAPMEQIAHRAGVGVGTVYRRFGHKNALVSAVATSVCDRLTTLADEALARDPGEALFLFITGCTDTPNPLRAWTSPPPWADEAVDIVRSRLLRVLDRLVRAAARAGTLRPGVTGADVVAALFGLRAVSDVFERHAPGTARRHLAVLTIGLRAPATRLPGHAMRPAQLAAALRSGPR